jgi:hypothetical protein
MPKYLRWYRFAFGRKLSLDELQNLTGTADNQKETG